LYYNAFWECGLLSIVEEKKCLAPLLLPISEPLGGVVSVCPVDHAQNPDTLDMGHMGVFDSDER